MRPKENYTNIPERDRCQTPAYALDPLLQYLPRDGVIWESCQGEGLLKAELMARGFDVVGSDIITGQDYFKYQPDRWDVQVTNPPYSIKYEWMERAFQLGPFALLLPVDTLGAKTAQLLFKANGIEIIYLDKRVNFKMPERGWESSATFAVAWFTHGLGIGSPRVFKSIMPRPQAQGLLLDELYKPPPYPKQKKLDI